MTAELRLVTILALNSVSNHSFLSPISNSQLNLTIFNKSMEITTKNFALLVCVFLVFSHSSGDETRFDEITPRIVGGTKADIEDYPYQVSVEYFGSHVCGGAILTPTIIVTPAHCCGDQIAYIKIRARSTNKDHGGSVISVSKVYNYPQFDPLTNDYDICVLELSEELTFSSNIQPISLCNKEIPDGTVCTATGWGATKSDGQEQKKLRVVSVPFISTKKCKKYFSNNLTPRMICAGEKKGGKGTCHGDNGAPLVCNGCLAGIQCWGRDCGQAKCPDIYTNIVNPNIRLFLKETAGL